MQGPLIEEQAALWQLAWQDSSQDLPTAMVSRPAGAKHLMCWTLPVLLKSLC